MTIKICCVGKLKERYLVEAVGEYTKRLGRYAKVEMVQVADERTPEDPSFAERELVLKKEGERLQKNIHPSDYCVALAIDGAMHSSESFAHFMDERMGGGDSRLCFVIGGSLGLSEKILQRANAKISFSKMTFPHQLMRVILLEQIYRGFRILRGEPYHK